VVVVVAGALVQQVRVVLHHLVALEARVFQAASRVRRSVALVAVVAVAPVLAGLQRAAVALARPRLETTDQRTRAAAAAVAGISAAATVVPVSS
jgi:hypothetical protein